METLNDTGKSRLEVLRGEKSARFDKSLNDIEAKANGGQNERSVARLLRQIRDPKTSDALRKTAYAMLKRYGY